MCAQFAVLSRWASPLPVRAIALTTLLVNARHIVMGAALQPFTRGLPGRLVLPLAGGMTDGGFAITLQTMMRGQVDFGVLAGHLTLPWPALVGCPLPAPVLRATIPDARRGWKRCGWQV